MKKLKRCMLCSAVILLATCLGAKGKTDKVYADAAIKSPQSVVIRSANYGTSNVIKVPVKKVVTTSTSKGSSSSKSADRGISISSANSNGVASFATQFVGRPYVWGAEGPRAFDCSGFVKYVYAQYGVSLDHYTGSQFNSGSAVSRAGLSPGDLVFFNTYGSISHVGIYIGGGKFVHAASSKIGVTISYLSEGYYAERYAGARRVK
jgi:cell wall-associated NlpC family hydrolase